MVKEISYKFAINIKHEIYWRTMLDSITRDYDATLTFQLYLTFVTYVHVFSYDTLKHKIISLSERSHTANILSEQINHPIVPAKNSAVQFIIPQRATSKEAETNNR